MIQFSLYAFIPLGVLIATLSAATAIVAWTATKPDTLRPARPARDAHIVPFPVPPARRRIVSAAAHPLAHRVIYLRTPMTG